MQKRELRQQQNNKCKLCQQLFKNDRDCVVDHCHNTGKIRGLLCNKCNKGIGLLNEDFNLILKASEYVKNKGEIVDSSISPLDFNQSKEFTPEQEESSLRASRLASSQHEP